MAFKHLFGPVDSRRLGRSLGVNCLTGKTCDLDCIYCECGPTTTLTTERKPWVPAAALITELDAYLANNPLLDYVTFGGSGEPTLNSDLGTIIAYVKQRYPNYPAALLTNATLFFLPAVRRECLPFDLVCPSLDAVSDAVFAKINRHHRELANREIIEGLAAFSREFSGKIWLEIFVVPGVNDTPQELALFKETIPRLRVDRIQINSLDRPAAYEGVRVPTKPELEKIADGFRPIGIPVEIISRAR
jgi:wyosine [tRNA(Phe)-imidazoG37] synthetase (radical SAM superfamily)